MRPVPVIVESDIGRHAVAVDAALREYRSTQEAFAVRRLALGRALVEARGCFPARGPKSKAWGDFLAARGVDQDVALEAMRYAGFVDEDPESREVPGNLPTRRQAGLDPDDDTGPRIIPAPSNGSTAPFRQLSESDLVQALARLDPEAKARVMRDTKPANPHGASGVKERGAWCTPNALAIAVGSWDLDPFSNPRSHVSAANRCMLENSGDGFGDGSGPGSFRVANRAAEYAGPETRVWIQPPYERGFVRDVVDHYKHTRFCALLRWSPDVEWFAALWPHVRVVAFPTGSRIEFEPPPGVDPTGDGGAPFPHALLYADGRDVTDEVRALCIVIPIDHATTDPRAIQPAAGL